MPQVANQSYAKAAQLYLSGADRDDALEEAAIPDTELSRSSVRRTIRKLKAEAKAGAEAAKAKAEALSPWALFRARRRRWARAAGRGAAREPCGCCRLGPSEARCAPLVRRLLLSDPGSWCSGTRRGLEQHDCCKGQNEEISISPRFSSI